MICGYQSERTQSQNKSFDFPVKFSRTFMKSSTEVLHSNPSFSAFWKIESLMANPTPCGPLACVTPPPAPLQYTVKPAAANPSCLVSCNPKILHRLCLQTSMISSTWPRPFLPLTARVRTLNVPTVNSPSQVFNLAALRTARLTRRVFRPLLLFLRAAFDHLTFRLLGVLPMLPTCRVQHSRPATSASILLCRLLPHVGSPVISTLHNTQPTLSATEPHRCRLKGRGGPYPRFLGCIPRPRPHARAPRARQYTDEVNAPHIPGTGTRHEVPGTGTLLWSDREGQGAGR